MNALQLEHLWTHAGGPASLQVDMAAISLAESHGRVGEWNRTDPYGGSFGLWQINGVHPFSSWRLMHDPLYNAQAAVYVWRHQGLGAWSTYTEGKYKRFLHQAQLAVGHDHRAHMMLATHHVTHRRPPGGHRTLVRHTVHHAPVQAFDPVQHAGLCFILALFCWYMYTFLGKLQAAFLKALREEVQVQRRTKRLRDIRAAAAYERRTRPRAGLVQGQLA